MGTVSWTYPAEIFPMRVRAKAVSLSTSANWVFNFALAWAVPPGLSNIAWKTYFIFGTFNFAAFIHIFFMFPETAGRTLEEIEDVFAQGHIFTAWKIKRDVGKKTLQDISHDGALEDNLMFAGHNAYRFGQDPFYSNNFVPTVMQLVERIATGR